MWSFGGANAQSDVELSAEISFWETVRDSDRPEELQAYLDAFPDGRFAALAILRLRALGAEPAAVESDTEAAAVEPVAVESGGERLLAHCLAATAEARRGPFAGVADPDLALLLCDGAAAGAGAEVQAQIHESKALIHLSVQDYQATLGEAEALLGDGSGRGEGLSCLAGTLSDSDVESLCAEATVVGDLFGLYGAMLQAANEGSDALQLLIAYSLAGRPDGAARRDLERTLGLLLEDRLLSPTDLPDGVLADLEAVSMPDMLDDAVPAIDLRLKAILRARSGDDVGREDALFLLNRAAALGDRQAMMALGQAALEDANGIAAASDGLREVLIERSENGAAWLQRLVAVGPHQGAYYATFAHLYGIGTNRDLVRAGDSVGLIRGPEIDDMRRVAGEVLVEAGEEPVGTANVLYLQLALARLGYKPGEPDGVRGGNTEAAYAAFAADRGLGDQPFDVEAAIRMVSEWEERLAARTDNRELDGTPPRLQGGAPDPLAFGWDAPYAF